MSTSLGMANDKRLDMGRQERRINRRIFACFILSAAGGVAFSFFFWFDGNIQYMGTSLGACFVFLAVGLIVWSHHFMPEGPFEEEYPWPNQRSPAETEAEVLARVDRGGIGRRRLLVGSVGVVGASVVAGVASEVRSFGPGPFSLANTGWRGGRMAVKPDGTPASRDGFPVGGFLTVYPEGFTNSPEAVAVIIHLPAGANHPLKGRQTWAPDGFVAYSKVCSHAGCPVNLYDHTAMLLMCPCHQSTFQANYAGQAIFGPAGGPLAQLPLTIDSNGVFHSTGDFSFPPGPAYWHYGPNEISGDYPKKDFL